ncbi:MAG: hypothetical protein ACT6S0_15715 [Roseateles sp.]
MRLGTIPEAGTAGFTQDRAHSDPHKHGNTMLQAHLRRDSGAWPTPVCKAYLLVCRLFDLQRFTLAKMLRDAHEADLPDARPQGRRDAAMQSQPNAQQLPESDNMKRLLAATSLSLALAMLAVPATAQSEISLAVSAAPVVLSMGAVSATGVALSAIPAGMLSAGVTLAVVSVEVVGSATVWVLERASDGARISLRTAGRLAEGVVVSTGAAVVVSVIAAGTVLSATGHVIAFIPNEVGKALLHNEQVSR